MRAFLFSEFDMKTIFLWLKIRALQITAQGQQDVLHLVADTATRERIQLAHINTLAEIDRLKAQRRRLLRGNGIRAVMS
jgi:hypothetical protein